MMLSEQDRGVLYANLAKAKRIEECGRGKKAQFRDAMAQPQVKADHHIKSDVAPSEQSETSRNYPPPCSPERLRLARRYEVSGSRYAFQALELCPLEMCPYLGRRL